MCFVAYEKPTDKGKHEEVIAMLNSNKIRGKDSRLIERLPWKQRATLRVETEEICIEVDGQIGLCDASRLLQLVWRNNPEGNTEHRRSQNFMQKLK